MTASLLLHLGVAAGLTLWLPRRTLIPPQAEQPVEIIYQAPAEAPPEVPQTPPVAAAPPAAEPPPPPPVETEVAPAPMPVPPPSPPAEAAEPAPPIPEPPPAPAQPAEEMPKPTPKPTSPRRQPPAVARTRPAAPPQPAAPAAPTPAPALAPAPPVAAAPADAPPAPVSASWREALAAWLAAHKSYPEEARRRGDEGSVVLRFTVERSGRVADVAVVRGSGSSILDAAAENMLRHAALPAFPNAMTQESVVISVQLRFTLRD